MDGNLSQKLQSGGCTGNLLTTAEVMELLDISRGTLYRLMNEGKLIPIRFNGNNILKHRRIRYSKEAVEKLMLEYNYDCSVSKL
jgi:excisionase family DNA binding protein